ncbi:MAG: DUF2917 domain-containing protein [Proteobacteria bacterium]|nr:MAG: DUF2917 domain-containing protein [Pseudomonadota bacterium]
MIYQVKLSKGEVWKPNALNGDRVHIAHGAAWVTYAGLQADYILSVGEDLPCLKKGVLIEALEDLILEFQAGTLMMSP